MYIRGLSTRLHTPLDILVISLARHHEQVHLLPAQRPVVYSSDAHYSPRATLPVRWCYRLTGPCQPWSQSELPDHHRSYWLMRQTIILMPTSVSLFQQVFAGCYKPLLEDGLSRRYLCDLCIGAWIHTPPRPNGAFRPFLTVGHRPPLRVKRIGS